MVKGVSHISSTQKIRPPLAVELFLCRLNCRLTQKSIPTQEWVLDITPINLVPMYYLPLGHVCKVAGSRWI